MAETAERNKQLRELENHLFRSLRGSKMDRAARLAALWVAFVDGISPALAAGIPIIPFILVSRGIILMQVGIISSVILNVIMLFVLGIFLGKVSGGNLWLHALFTSGAGVVTALFLLVISAL